MLIRLFWFGKKTEPNQTEKIVYLNQIELLVFHPEPSQIVSSRTIKDHPTEFSKIVQLSKFYLEKYKRKFNIQGLEY